MDKTELLRRYAREEGDRIPLAQALDKLTASEHSGNVTSTMFLNERQQELIRLMLIEARSSRHVFWGGYKGAVRRVAFFLPDWAGDDNPEAFAPLSFIRAVWSEKTNAELNHRDFLGALMGAGIKRETIGDILPSNNSCDIIVLKNIAPYLIQNFTSAGRAALSLTEIEPLELIIPEPEHKIIRDTVASLRLDSVVSGGFGISREKASELIKSGRVVLNGAECVKPDRQLSGGDIVSARGFGKFRLSNESHTTKKGRIGIIIEKFI